MESDKKQANVDRAQLFVQQLMQHTGMSLADLERVLEIGSHGEMPGEKNTSGDAGETLKRWRDGRARKVTMRTLQELAQVAYAKEMLPPLREGGLHRRDVFLSLDQMRDADTAWGEKSKKMQRIEKLHATAIEAIQAFAEVLDEDKDLLIVDTSIEEEIEGRTAEIGPDDVRAVADQLGAIRYAKMHPF